MKYRVLFLFIAVILAGCSAEKRLARLLERYPIPADTVIKDSIVYRDRDVYVNLPGDTVVRNVEIEVPVDLPDTSITARTDYSRATASIQDNTLGLELVQIDTMVVVRVDSVEVIKYQDRTITQTVTVEGKPNPFWRNGFIVLAVLVVVGMVLLFLFLRGKK